MADSVAVVVGVGLVGFLFALFGSVVIISASTVASVAGCSSSSVAGGPSHHAGHFFADGLGLEAFFF